MLEIDLNQDVSKCASVTFILNSYKPITLREFIKQTLTDNLCDVLNILGYYPEDLYKYDWVLFGEECYEAKKLARREFTPISV